MQPVYGIVYSENSSLILWCSLYINVTIKNVVICYTETLTQHYLFPSRVDLYIKEEDIQAWHKLLTKHGLVGKGNIRLLLEDEHVFYSNIKKKGLRIVSIPQLILDFVKRRRRSCRSSTNADEERIPCHYTVNLKQTPHTII